MVPRPASRSPRGAKHGPKRAQEDLQMDQRRLHGTPRELKEVQRSEGGGSGASKIGKVGFSKSLKNQMVFYDMTTRIELEGDIL